MLKDVGSGGAAKAVVVYRGAATMRLRIKVRNMFGPWRWGGGAAQKAVDEPG